MAIDSNISLLTRGVDISGIADEYRDGLKLRQEYEQRQQQKAFNDLMKISDFNERMAAAGQHKYAGALVPMVQQYEEARQKADQDWRKGEADIQNTFAEAGKLGAETGKIGAEAEGEQLKTATGVKDYISAAALTRDPRLFGMAVGELYKRGLYTAEQTKNILALIQKDPKSASKLLQRQAMANPEIAKAFMPQVNYSDLGNRVEATEYNPLTGQMEGLGGYNKGVSPDNALDNETSRLNNVLDNQTSLANNQYTNDTAVQRSQISANASMYNADVQAEAKKYGIDLSAENAAQKLEFERQKAEIEANEAEYKTFGGKVYLVYKNGEARPALDANGKQITDIKPAAVSANGQPVRKLEANERKKIMELQENMQSVQSALATLDKMSELADDDKTYSGFGAGMRAKIASNLGIGGEAANNTVVYDNMATEQALMQLKAVFGGMPTEGERKILLDIQASANKTPEQKKAILENAKEAAKRRLEGYKQQADSIKSGDYLQPSGGKKSKLSSRVNNPFGHIEDPAVAALASKYF